MKGLQGQFVILTQTYWKHFYYITDIWPIFTFKKKYLENSKNGIPS